MFSQNKTKCLRFSEFWKETQEDAKESFGTKRNNKEHLLSNSIGNTEKSGLLWIFPNDGPPHVDGDVENIKNFRATLRWFKEFFITNILGLIEETPPPFYGKIPK